MSADPYIRPTLTALRAQALQDITTSDLPGADGLLRKSVLRVMSWVMAGFAWLHYDYLDFIYQQSNPWSAQGAAALGWGGLIGVSPKDATFAGSDGIGAGTFGNSQVGKVLPAGTPVIRLDGFGYVTKADVTVGTDGTVTAPLLASEPGSVGNAPVGTVLRIGNAIEGIASSGAVAAAIVDGADIEAFDAFKARYLLKYQLPPQGGDAADYIEWAEAIPGVSRAWVLPSGAGPGTVVLWTMFDTAEAGNQGFPLGVLGVASAEPRDTPATGDLLTVANAIFPLRPVCALVYSCAPAATAVNFTIANLQPNTPAMQAAIRAALTDMFLLLGQVGGAVDPATMQLFDPLYPSDWNEAVDGIPGLQHCTIASPSIPLTPATGQLFVLGTVTFSS